VNYNDTATLQWTSQNTAGTCTAGGGNWSGPQALNGTKDITNVIASGKLYTLTCQNSDGDPASDTAEACGGQWTKTRDHSKVLVTKQNPYPDKLEKQDTYSIPVRELTYVLDKPGEYSPEEL